jgi:hypothetical protein
MKKWQIGGNFIYDHSAAHKTDFSGRAIIAKRALPKDLCIPYYGGIYRTEEEIDERNIPHTSNINKLKLL